MSFLTPVFTARVHGWWTRAVCTELQKLETITAFVTVRADMAYRRHFHAAGKFWENQLPACSLSVSIRNASYRRLLFPQKHRELPPVFTAVAPYIAAHRQLVSQLSSAPLTPKTPSYLYSTLEFVFNRFFFSPLGPRDLDTQVRKINTTIKITSVCDGDARSVGGGRGWLAGDTDALAGWLMTGDGGRG